MAVHPDDTQSTIDAWNAAVADKRTFIFEHRLRRGDGEWRRYSIRAIPIFDEDGDICEWVGVHTDVTEQRIAEAALHELNETLEQQVAERTAEVESTWRLSQDLLVINEPDGSLAAVNEAWSKALGWTEQELVGKTFMELAHPDDVAPTLELFKTVFETPLTEPYEYRLRHKDGSYRWIAWTAAFHNGRIFASGRDVTERRARLAELEAAQEALRQSQKMEAMGSLTGGVAHDFNNLLSPIIGGLDLLERRGIGDERAQRIISGALQSAERAKTLVQRLLAFARRQPLQPTAVDAGALVQGMADLVSSTTGPQVKVVVNVAPDLPPAMADANQIEMALLNLSVNARDAMPDGGLLTISAAVEEVGPAHPAKLAPGRYIALVVADTGTGMDETTLARAIEPFYSTKGVGKGTGLGLSMVHGLAGQLGGALTIGSQLGLGTKVELLLPIADRAADSPGKQLKADGTGTTGTVLLVDDENLVRASTAEMLGDLGFATVEASCAAEALRLLDEGLTPDLLITDHLMPDKTGTLLAREVSERLPAMPVLIISGYAEVDGVAADFARLTKPFRRDELTAALVSIMAKYSPTQERCGQ